MIASLVIVSNRPQYAQNVLNQMISQTYRPLEIIYIANYDDDNVLDNLKQQYQGKDQNQITFIFDKQPNLVLGDLYNRGKELFTGDIFFKIDDDDIYCPNYVQKYMKFYETHKNIDYLGQHSFFIHFIGENLPLYINNFQQNSFHNLSNWIVGPTISIKRNILKQYKWSAIKNGIDFELLIWLNEKNYKGYSIDCQDFCLIRNKNQTHTWQIQNKDLIKRSITLNIKLSTVSQLRKIIPQIQDQVLEQKQSSIQKQIFENYPTIHWVNLDIHKERRENMESQLQKYGFKNMRHKGVEIKSKEDVLKYLDFNIYSTNHLDNCNQKKFNEFGCFIAHLQTIRDCYEQNPNEQYYFIMEDDMYFDDFVFYKLKWEDILKFINKDAIAINLANIQRRFINDLNNKSIKSKVQLTIHKFPSYGTSGTGAYLIRNDYAKMIAKSHINGKFNILCLNYLQQIQQYQYRFLMISDHFLFEHKKIQDLPLFSFNLNNCIESSIDPNLERIKGLTNEGEIDFFKQLKQRAIDNLECIKFQNKLNE